MKCEIMAHAYIKTTRWLLRFNSTSNLLERIRDPQLRLDRISGVEDAHLDVLIAFDDGAERVLEFSMGRDQLVKLCQLGLSAVVTVH